MTKEEFEKVNSKTRETYEESFIEDMRTHYAGVKTHTYNEYKADKRCKEGYRVAGQVSYQTSVYAKNSNAQRRQEIREFIKHEAQSTTKDSFGMALGRMDAFGQMINPFFRHRGINAIKKHMNRVYKDVTSEQESLKYFNQEIRFCHFTSGLGIFLGLIYFLFKKIKGEDLSAYFFIKINF